MWFHVVSCDLKWFHVISWDFMCVHVVSCDFMWFQVISCDFMWFHWVPCDSMWFHVISTDFTWFHVISCDFMWFHAISCDFMRFHVISCDFMWFHVVSCDFMWFAGENIRKHRRRQHARAKQPSKITPRRLICFDIWKHTPDFIWFHVISCDSVWFHVISWLLAVLQSCHLAMISEMLGNHLRPSPICGYAPRHRSCFHPGWCTKLRPALVPCRLCPKLFWDDFREPHF